jgi:PPM family protein phosphatase
VTDGAVLRCFSETIVDSFVFFRSSTGGTGNAETHPMAIHLTAYGQTDVGRKRQNNEDAFVIADLTGGELVSNPKTTRLDVGPRGVLFAVSDGVGGEKAGEVASALVVESLRRAMVEARPSVPPAELIETATQRANREVWKAARTPGCEKMGATLTAAYVCETDLYIAEVGDSRGYLLRNGTITQITKDQSFVQFLVDTGKVSPEEAKHSQFKNVILQAMGQKSDLDVAVGHVELRPRDCVLLCSDGLSNKLSDDELRAVVLGNPSLEAAGATLIAKANERGGDDNITVILAGVGGQ